MVLQLFLESHELLLLGFVCEKSGGDTATTSRCIVGVAMTTAATTTMPMAIITKTTMTTAAITIPMLLRTKVVGAWWRGL